MDILALLKKIAFFSVFDEEELLLLSRNYNHFVQFKGKERIIKEGEEDFSLMVLVKGKCSVTKNAKPETSLATLTPGVILGEVSFLTKRPRTTNVVALDACIVFKMDADGLGKLGLKIQNKIKDQLIEILVARLEQMNLSLAEM